MSTWWTAFDLSDSLHNICSVSDLELIVTSKTKCMVLIQLLLKIGCKLWVENISCTDSLNEWFKVWFWLEVNDSRTGFGDGDIKLNFIVVSTLCIYYYIGYGDIFELIPWWYLVGGVFTVRRKKTFWENLPQNCLFFGKRECNSSARYCVNTVKHVLTLHLKIFRISERKEYYCNS